MAFPRRWNDLRSVMQQDLEGVNSTLERMIDEQLIRAVLLNYCQGVDRKNWDQVQSCYHDDATDSHGVAFEGPPADLVEWMKGTHKNVEFSMHVRTNTTVQFSEDARHALTEG